MAEIKIANRVIGDNQPCFIIAEAGVNHNGNMDIAHKLIDAVVEAGADAVKFQSFITEELVTPEAPKADYQVKATGKTHGQYEMLKALELSADQQACLKAYCGDKKILYLCTPYENTSVDILDRINIAAFKISSTDATNIPFLRYIASKGRPVILSTGMSTLDEVKEAVAALRDGGLEDRIAILHCTSGYPAPYDDANLRAIVAMRQRFSCPVGFSDHTMGVDMSAWAVAIGACIIEKHITLDRNMQGPDHRASLEPAELKKLVWVIRDVERALGDGIKRPMPSEISNKQFMQKSLVARRHIRAGEVIKADALACKRPAAGLMPSLLDKVVGKRAAADIPKDGILTMSSVKWNDA